ncbi:MULTISPECIES: hypothetical protein [Bacillus]|uniref:Uncharacterized protein n=1 Tax=Bacillus velezensis TaxID=492670 RepID=A0ABC8D2V1_BACVE|nr:MULTISPECIES: hypothetical protein [Bacillus]AJC24807.1 hypothetical protein SB24_06270 [Bacillus sp. Pc3]ANB46845.1 hypothetical protein A1D33_005835 [Bacillus velezensis]AVI27524.1 hypothetical protein C3Z10_03670 [Bacillus velezensis]AWX71173.1 hypothetical protein BVDSYZ_03670 [Bacillus velezensis]MBD8889323.1 hypothetical protein [Bacillus velezensis]
MTVRRALIKQINLTITAIKTNNQKNPTPMVKILIKRYEEGNEFILQSSDEQFEEDLSKVRNKLDTLTRAYLESANNYMNPMLIVSS